MSKTILKTDEKFHNTVQLVFCIMSLKLSTLKQSTKKLSSLQMSMKGFESIAGAQVLKKELLTITFAQNMEMTKKVHFPQLFEIRTINIVTSQTVLYNCPVTCNLF